MTYLIDTQALAWIGTGSGRLSRRAVATLLDADNELFVSAVTAFEFVDLNMRGRFDADLPFHAIVDRLGASLLDYPAEAYRILPLLPLIHRDPVDRMLIAHAVHADLTLITADTDMREYPVRSLW